MTLILTHPMMVRLGKKEIVIIGLMAAATFSVLDVFVPSIASSARGGAGFGIGANLVGFPRINML